MEREEDGTAQTALCAPFLEEFRVALVVVHVIQVQQCRASSRGRQHDWYVRLVHAAARRRSAAVAQPHRATARSEMACLCAEGPDVPKRRREGRERSGKYSGMYMHMYMFRLAVRLRAPTCP